MFTTKNVLATLLLALLSLTRQSTAKLLSRPRTRGLTSLSMVKTLGYDASSVQVSESGELSGTFLIAAKDVKKGECILSVPIDMCLVANKDGQVFGLRGQNDFIWEIAGDLCGKVSDAEYEKGRTWDVQLAIALLQATDGTDLHRLA